MEPIAHLILPHGTHVVFQRARSIPNTVNMTMDYTITRRGRDSRRAILKALQRVLLSSLHALITLSKDQPSRREQTRLVRDQRWLAQRLDHALVHEA